MNFAEYILLAEGAIYILCLPSWLKIFHKIVIRHHPEGLSFFQWLGLLGLALSWPLIVSPSYYELLKKQSQKAPGNREREEEPNL